MTPRFIAGALGVAAALATGGCYSVSYGPAGHERHGVWLPKTGYGESRKTAREIVVGGQEARFDEALRVYRLVELPDHFYSAGWFYRRVASGWEGARSLEGHWRSMPHPQVPPTLLDLAVPGLLPPS